MWSEKEKKMKKRPKKNNKKTKKNKGQYKHFIFVTFELGTDACFFVVLFC